MTYRNAPRFEALGYFGVPDYPALCINVLADGAFEAAKRFGGVLGVEKYGDGDTTHLMLKHDLIYLEGWNDKANWVQSAGKAQYFAAAPAVAFRGTGIIGGLAFTNGAANSTSLFTTSETILGPNAPWTLRLILQKPDSSQYYSRFIADWGDWRFQIENGDACMVRKAPITSESPGYSEAADNERMKLLNQKNVPAGDQARADEIEARIYADKTSIDRVGSDDWYETTHEVTFIPTAHGIVNVVIEGTENATEICDSSKTNLLQSLGGPSGTRSGAVAAARQMWPATRVTVGSNGGAFAWQLGRPLYPASGTFNMVPFKSQRGHTDPASIGANINAEANGANNSIVCGVVNYPDPTADISGTMQVQVKFASDGFTSPILYAAQVFEQGGSRDGVDETALDTNTLSGGSQIVDIVPQFEENDRRTSVTVTMRWVKGAYINGDLFPGQEEHDDAGRQMRPFLHDRLANVSVNGVTLLGNGIITSSTVNQVTQLNMAGFPDTYAVGDTHLVFNIADMWELANRFRLKRQPVGDGMTLGAYIRRILGMMGFHDSEIEGVSEGAGRMLPQAAFGEKPCVQPANDAYGGEFLRTLMDSWGMGLRLSCNTGVWTLAAPSTTSVATFSTDSTVATWAARFANPPVYRVMRGNAVAFDFGDFYNSFTVIGGKDANGLPIIATWRNVESMSGDVNAPFDPSFIGYEKPYETVTNEGLRTLDDVQFTCRALATKYGRPGRFFNFRTWWIDGIHPGDVVTIDGMVWVISRITSASVKEDRMSFTARQDLAVGGGF